MKRTVFIMFVALITFGLIACEQQNQIKEKEIIHDTITVVVHDTVNLTAGEYVYNVPCKVFVIHPELEGKALLMLWLHGGVHAGQKNFTLLDWGATEYTQAPKKMKEYLERTDKKAIILLPICKHADTSALQSWPDCWRDIEKMIEGYVQKDLVDKNRIYVSGSSDGGTGTWQYASQHPDVFAAGISLSSSLCLGSSIPVYWFTTKSEGDQSARADMLNAQGSNVHYKYCDYATHGGDDKEITDSLLDIVFSIRK